jgi:hypothetical protein
VLPRLDDKTVAGGSNENVLFSIVPKNNLRQEALGSFDGWGANQKPVSE